jgi:hypothetical protein
VIYGRLKVSQIFEVFFRSILEYMYAPLKGRGNSKWYGCLESEGSQCVVAPGMRCCVTPPELGKASMEQLQKLLLKPPFKAYYFMYLMYPCFVKLCFWYLI